MNKEYIEKEAANKELQRFSGYLDEDMIFRLRFAINRLPAADVKPVVRSKWELWAGSLPKCPVCGYEYTDYIECDKFCGNCGADMRQEQG